MKKMFDLMKKRTVSAFTLVEMLIVLLIISFLMLLFVPNLTKQKVAVQDKGNAAVIKVVESQMDLYELGNGKSVTVEELKNAGYITKEQAEAYKEYEQQTNSDSN
ncbi:competence protein ComGC [Streptococcus henryi]|uniref:Competence protein ComGC n=1 Tax=Streptococcus henryi TaxID=439219 RepID=A0A1G6BSL6_9STRE|nr:competence type IV pilus major pilin ComGC [Streptococcus henryi]SDB23604.1 competence protein ComGC [Streptococcus henryi]